VEPDVCQTSIELLREHCISALDPMKKMGVTSLAFADHQDFPQALESRKTAVTDVILFGGFLLRFLESGLWPDHHYRLWVVSTAVRDILVRLCGIPAKHIGLIPRYGILPAAEHPRRLPEIQHDPTALVFGGRISAVKNIECLLRTVSSLQIDHNCPVSLSLLGAFDDQYHSDYGRRAHNGYEEYLHSLVHALPWSRQPAFLQKMGREEWIKAAGDEPVLINLSSFMMEDFDVSLAQAQAAGWPAIISDWGGHRDAGGMNVMKISPQLIAHSHEPPGVQELKAKALASRLISRSFSFSSTLSGAALSEVPVPIHARELDHFRREFLQRTGPDAHLIYRESNECFADSPCGLRFFRSYRSLFSGLPPADETVVLINDLHDANLPELRHLRSLCLEILRLASLAKRSIVFLPIQNLDEVHHRMTFLQAQSVIVPFVEDGILPFLESWLISEPKASVRILFNSAQGKSSVETVTTILRAQDSLITYDDDLSNITRAAAGALA